MLVLGIFIALTGGALLLVRGKAEPIVLTALGLAQVCSGHVLLDRIHGTKTAIPIAGFSALTIVAYAIQHARLRRNEPCPSRPAGSANNRRRLQAIAVFVCAGASLHFLLGGVPLFSDNVEVSRFNFTASGLFGVPGRLYVYGLPLVALYVAVARSRAPDAVSRFAYRLVWTTFLATRLLGGFKGGVWEVTTISLLALFISRPNAHFIPAVARVRFLLLGGIALMFAGFLALQYASIAIPSADRAAPYLLDRYTMGSAQAGHFGLTHSLIPPAHGHYHFDEVVYFGREYLGLDWGAASVQPLDRILSAMIVGLSPSDQSFRAPVTLGAGSSLMIDFGIPIALAIAVLVGLTYRRVVEQVRRVSSGGPLWPFAVLVAFNTWFHNGGMVHLAINWAAITAMLRLVSLGTDLLALRRSDPKSRIAWKTPVGTSVSITT